MKTKRKSDPTPEPANTNTDPAPKTKRGAVGGRGQPVEVKTPRSYGDPEQALPIDFGPGYKPGDVFANVFAGLPGFEDVAAPAPGDTSAVATAGLQGPSQPLPHADAIQKSFGDNDVSHIKAHVGGPAAAAATALGAEAYALGDAVAFKEQPDLHTAAHEAAHVVQATGQVKFKGKSGTSNDRDEKQADAAADKVVEGEPADALEQAEPEHACEGTDAVLTKEGLLHLFDDTQLQLGNVGKSLGPVSTVIETVINTVSGSQTAGRKADQLQAAIDQSIEERGKTDTFDLTMNAVATALSAATAYSLVGAKTYSHLKMASALVSAARKGKKTLESKSTGVEEALAAAVASVNERVQSLETNVQTLGGAVAEMGFNALWLSLGVASNNLESVARSVSKSLSCDAPHNYSEAVLNAVAARVAKVRARIAALTPRLQAMQARLLAAQTLGDHGEMNKMVRGEKYRSLHDRLEGMALAGEIRGLVLLKLQTKDGRSKYKLECTEEGATTVRQFLEPNRLHRQSADGSSRQVLRYRLDSVEGEALGHLVSIGLPVEDRVEGTE